MRGRPTSVIPDTKYWECGRGRGERWSTGRGQTAGDLEVATGKVASPPTRRPGPSASAGPGRGEQAPPSCVSGAAGPFPLSGGRLRPTCTALTLLPSTNTTTHGGHRTAAAPGRELGLVSHLFRPLTEWDHPVLQAETTSIHIYGAEPDTTRGAMTNDCHHRRPAAPSYTQAQNRRRRVTWTAWIRLASAAQSNQQEQHALLKLLGSTHRASESVWAAATGPQSGG